ncbi:hypothetical protein BH11ARM2_BH11ARM2_13820 [soil metagenome]
MAIRFNVSLPKGIVGMIHASFQIRAETQAFTLVELLTVVAIITILAALLFPVLGAARHRAQDPVALADLRQAGMALLMYMDGEGDRAPPVWSAARAAIPAASACDPRDFWPEACSLRRETPMIGSFAYVRAVGPFRPEDGPDSDSLTVQQLEDERRRVPLLIDVFAASNRFRPFTLNDLDPRPARCGPNLVDCPSPTVCWGSASTARPDSCNRRPAPIPVALTRRPSPAFSFLTDFRLP